MSEGTGDQSKQQDGSIIYPHDHDVLSGRGNFVNYHPGNEYFRELVRQHKVAYVACPKARKGKFSRMIVDEIGKRDPPGRFLKQDNDTKLWYDIGDKKALDKTRQALREGAPELLKDLSPGDEEEVDSTPLSVHEEYGGPSGFGRGETPNFISSSFGSSMGQQGQGDLNLLSPSMIHSSGMMQMGGVLHMQDNRVIPGTMSIPPGTTQLAGLRQSGGGYSALSRAGYPESVYESVHLEPTPINPNAQLTIAVDGAAPAPMRRGIQRDDSLTFDIVFTKEKVSTEKPTRKMENSSQHLSAMSFSIGDMTDASNLSAVFEDSMRISEDAPSVYPRIDNSRKLPPANYANESDHKKKAASKFDMSVASSLGSVGLETSMMHMSFRSGFDEDSTKD